MQCHCNICKEIFIAEAVYQDAPTQSVPTNMRIVTPQSGAAQQEPEMRIQKQTTPIPSLAPNALPSPQTNSGTQKESPKKRKVKPHSPVGKRRPVKRAGSKQPNRKKRRITAVKTQSSFPPQFIIIIVLCLVAVAVIIAIASSGKKKASSKQTKPRTYQQPQHTKKTENMFLDMLHKNKR